MEDPPLPADELEPDPAEFIERDLADIGTVGIDPPSADPAGA